MSKEQKSSLRHPVLHQTVKLQTFKQSNFELSATHGIPNQTNLNVSKENLGNHTPSNIMASILRGLMLFLHGTLQCTLRS